MTANGSICGDPSCSHGFRSTVTVEPAGRFIRAHVVAAPCEKCAGRYVVTIKQEMRAGRLRRQAEADRERAIVRAVERMPWVCRIAGSDDAVACGACGVEIRDVLRQTHRASCCVIPLAKALGAMQ